MKQGLGQGPIGYPTTRTLSRLWLKNIADAFMCFHMLCVSSQRGHRPCQRLVAVQLPRCCDFPEPETSPLQHLLRLPRSRQARVPSPEASQRFQSICRDSKYIQVLPSDKHQRRVVGSFSTSSSSKRSLKKRWHLRKAVIEAAVRSSKSSNIHHRGTLQC